MGIPPRGPPPPPPPPAQGPLHQQQQQQQQQHTEQQQQQQTQQHGKPQHHHTAHHSQPRQWRVRQQFHGAPASTSQPVDAANKRQRPLAQHASPHRHQLLHNPDRAPAGSIMGRLEQRSSASNHTAHGLARNSSGVTEPAAGAAAAPLVGAKVGEGVLASRDQLVNGVVGHARPGSGANLLAMLQKGAAAHWAGGTLHAAVDPRQQQQQQQQQQHSPLPVPSSVTADGQVHVGDQRPAHGGSAPLQSMFGSLSLEEIYGLQRSSSGIGSNSGSNSAMVPQPHPQLSEPMLTHQGRPEDVVASHLMQPAQLPPPSALPFSHPGAIEHHLWQQHLALQQYSHLPHPPHHVFPAPHSQSLSDGVAPPLLDQHFAAKLDSHSMPMSSLQVRSHFGMDAVPPWPLLPEGLPLFPHQGAFLPFPAPPPPQPLLYPHAFPPPLFSGGDPNRGASPPQQHPDSHSHGARAAPPSARPPPRAGPPPDAARARTGPLREPHHQPAAAASGDLNGHARHGTQDKRRIALRHLPPKLRDAPLTADMRKADAMLQQLVLGLVPSDAHLEKRALAFNRVRAVVEAHWPQSQLHLFGSSVNGLCTSGSSDMDLSLQLPGATEHTEKGEVVSELGLVMERGGMMDVRVHFKARVPVCKFVEPNTGINGDITINNSLAIVNSQLLRHYVQIDSRLQFLVFVIKHWARMVCDGWSCDYFDQVDKLKDFGAKNTETLADLVFAFFKYWAYEHDYSSLVVSVRLGGWLTKADKGWAQKGGRERHFMCIEDPLNLSHDLGQIIDAPACTLLRKEFERACKLWWTEEDVVTPLFEPVHDDSRRPRFGPNRVIEHLPLKEALPPSSP